MNYGIKIIREIEPKSYIFRLDADEIFIKSKININHLKKFIFDNNVKAFSIERDIYYKNKPISNDLKQDVIRLFSCHLEYENSLIMDEFINSNCVNIKFLKILDLRNSSISEHFERHLIYANRECENYFKNKVTNFRNFKKHKKIYYKFPFFFRSIMFGFFSLFRVRLNKNFLYNFKYQIIRTLIFRIYVDYLILKKK